MKMAFMLKASLEIQGDKLSVRELYKQTLEELYSLEQNKGKVKK